MTTIEAAFQDGVFKPLGKVQLADNQPVHILVSAAAPPDRTCQTARMFPWFRTQTWMWARS